MSGFEALQKVKDEMLKPEYEKRRHLGCEFCGHTFYGRYQKTGYNAVPNGITTPSTREGWIKVHKHSDIFFPECPRCMVDFGVGEAKEALALYEYEQERKRKNKAAAEKRKATIERKRKEYWDRVRHVRENPNDATMEELKSYRFIEALVGRPYYGNRDKETFWDQDGGKNGKYLVKFHLQYKGHSRSGKTHYYNEWFDMMNVDTGKTWQVGKVGNRKNIFDEEIS
jgi:hypothetical protein